MTEWRSLDYLTEFKCIGAQCEDTCCANWQILIDGQTLGRYRAVLNPRLKVIIDQAVLPNVLQNPQGEQATVSPRPDGSCAFLGEDRLCSIQCELGESYLSDTCSLFPRSQSSVFGSAELSANLSCPEAARLALKRRGGINLVPASSAISPRPNIISRRVQSKTEAILSSSEIFYSLRQVALSLILNRSYQLGDRIILLGMYLNRVEPVTIAGNVELVLTQSKEFIEQARNGAMAELLRAIPRVTTIQVKLLKELTDKRIVAGRVHARFLDCYNQFCSGLDIRTGITDEALAANYEQLHRQYFIPFEQTHPHFLENYLVNHVIRTLFPAGEYGGLFDEFVMLTLHYAIVRLLLIGVAGAQRGLTEDDGVRVIQSFSRTIEHNSSFLQGILAILTASNLRSMPHMAILLRS